MYSNEHSRRTAGPLVGALVGMGILVAACASEDAAEWTPVEARIVDHGWTQKFSLGGAADTVLQNPIIVETSGGRIALWDDGRKSVSLYDSLGDLQWRIGRQGQGPAEFQRVRDISFDQDGRLYVLDADNGRIARIVDGEVTGRVMLPPAGMPMGMVTDGTRHRIVVMSDEAMLLLGPGGRVMAHDSLPHIPEDVHPMAAQAVIGGTTDAWALAFVFGGGWMGAPNESSAQSPYYRQLVSDPGFPEVERRGKYDVRLVDARSMIKSVSVVDSTVFMHRYNRSEGHGYVDLFNFADGRYRESWRLPAEAGQAFTSSISGNLIALLKADPSPTVLVYKLER